MSIVTYKPTSSGRRRSSVNRRPGLTKTQVKRLKKSMNKKSGRNNQGKITVRHRGGGSKSQYRVVDFKRDKFDIPANVLSLDYDPNRSAHLALLVYRDGEKRYVIAPTGLAVGDTVVSSNKKIDIAIGNNMPLKYIPVGQVVSSVELHPESGARLARSAGNGIVLMGIDSGFAQLKMPSGEVRLVPELCRATLGGVSNQEHGNVRVGKAGRVRHSGKRPTVRGKAMNPVDHPHGGGEGSQPIGMKHPKTPWGKPALGVKTRKQNQTSDRLILKRRRTKKRK